VLVVQILTVTRSGSGLRAGWWFVFGAAMGVALWIALALVVGHALPHPLPGPDPEAACLRLVLALVLLGLGLKLLGAAPGSGQARAGEQGPSPGGEGEGRQEGPAAPGHPMGRAVGLGLVTMASNLTSLVLVFPAVHDLGRDRLPGLQEALLVGLIALFTLLPALAPPLLLLASGASGRRQLERLNGWTQAHSVGSAALYAWALACCRPSAACQVFEPLAGGLLDPLGAPTQIRSASSSCTPSRRSPL